MDQRDNKYGTNGQQGENDDYDEPIDAVREGNGNGKPLTDTPPEGERGKYFVSNVSFYWTLQYLYKGNTKM